jgi:hypothetical protein
MPLNKRLPLKCPDFSRAKGMLGEAAEAMAEKIRQGPLAPFLTDAAGEPVPKHAAGDLVAIADETWRVGYAKGDTLVLERVRPTDVQQWDRGEADPLADLGGR